MDKIQNTPQPDSRSKIDRVERAPEKRDRDQLDEQGQNFSEKLGGKGEKQQGQDKAGLPMQERKLMSPAELLAQQAGVQNDDTATDGDAILAQFLGQNVKPEATTQHQNSMQAGKIEAAPPSSGVQDISRVAEVIADRILVSDSKFTDQKMISIRVKDDILPQTEIRVSTGENGALKIEVKTGSADAFSFLGSQRDGLAKHLQNTLPQSEIEVSVEMEGAEDDGQPGDGRSRNQRDIYEEMQEKADASDD